MKRDTERLLDDLRNVIGELEALLAQPAEHLEKGAADVQETLHGLRGRMNELQTDFQRRVGKAVHDADRSIRESPWTAVAIAAAAMLLLGLALGSSTHSEP